MSDSGARQFRGAMRPPSNIYRKKHQCPAIRPAGTRIPGGNSPPTTNSIDCHVSLNGQTPVLDKCLLEQLQVRTWPTMAATRFKWAGISVAVRSSSEENPIHQRLVLSGGSECATGELLAPLVIKVASVALDPTPFNGVAISSLVQTLPHGGEH